MDRATENLPNDVNLLKRLVEHQQAALSCKDEELQNKDQELRQVQHKLENAQTLLACLEEKIRLLQQRQFGASCERHDEQIPLQLFNEAELAAFEADANGDDDLVEVPAHRRRRGQSKALPKNLPRVRVEHDIDEAAKQCECGQIKTRIDEEVTEQLAKIPEQYYVIDHVRFKYACSCHNAISTAPMPKQPLPGTKASAVLLAHVMVAKYVDGLPLYRQERIAARQGLELARAKLARWLINLTPLLQMLFNLIEDVFFSYDIAWCDDTTIQVLKEDGRSSDSKSYLWIRRGGPPLKPVVLVDYRPSKSGETAYGLLADFKEYLVCDAASNFNQSIRNNKLVVVNCNDHARRKFDQVLKSLDKKSRAKQWICNTAIGYYKRLYKLERQIKDLTPEQRLEHRQNIAVPIWDDFIAWAQRTYSDGVIHQASREALQYLLAHEKGLREYCNDGRLPISNILAEHVAKAIAVPRKNFLFCDTAAGAKSSAMIFSMLQTAMANGHNPFEYMSVVLTDLPNANDVADVEKLLPWNISPATVKQRYLELPRP